MYPRVIVHKRLLPMIHIWTADDVMKVVLESIDSWALFAHDLRKTPTRHFMALDLIKGALVPHHARRDIEPMFGVLACNC
ncbi:hypothetical protein BS47DRAFT_867934 [Hydnum rufescens UP504]|uniref:Uncharacterized protein n=1 Tax=Hydnum rufescens UP504 TaxID=1448309 RepID=A0A9P6AZ16_9AGAM|nr:hypothetical protein BS47DRAFT_867934 [Hydnum rufescens UP504]